MTGDRRRGRRRLPGMDPVCAVGLGCLLAAGCEAVGDAGARSDSFAITDSAGVEIVTNARPAWEEGEAWTIDPEPYLVIGDREDEPGHQFTQILSGAAARLADGRIVVIDAVTAELRVFSADGAFEFTIGREGDGPGEFSRPPEALHRYRGDSIVVTEFGGGRVSVFDDSGRFGRRFQPDFGWAWVEGFLPAESCCHVRGALPDGTFIADHPDLIPESPSGPEFAQKRMILLDAEGRLLGDLATVDGMQIMPDPSAPNGVGSLRWGGFGAVAVGGGVVWLGNTAVPTISQYVTDQGLVRRVRLSFEAIPIDASVIAADPYPRDAPYADHLPYFGNPVIDHDGAIWLSVYPDPRAPDDRPYRFNVVSAEGIWLGVVESPVGVWPLQIGPDYIIGTATDEYDVPRLQVHRLDRGG